MIEPLTNIHVEFKRRGPVSIPDMCDGYPVVLWAASPNYGLGFFVPLWS
jgi:hypothetical protein